MVELDDDIDPGLLRRYMTTFLGFGSATAECWFVGPEQGGGESLDELNRRVRVWSECGAGGWADLADYHRLIGIDRWHGSAPKIQPTWGKLVRLYLSMTGKTVDTEAVRRFQARSLGASDGTTALVELMPLPSRSLSEWIYGSLNAMPELASRDTYRANFYSKRIELLRSTIRRCCPRVVVFYGKNEDSWVEVAQCSFESKVGKARWTKRDGTTYVVVPHPTAYGVTNAEFEEIGRTIGSQTG